MTGARILFDFRIYELYAQLKENMNGEMVWVWAG